MKIIRAADVEPVEMVPGIQRRTLAYGEHVMLAHVTLEEGAVVPSHSHPHEQVSYVVEGELEMTVAGETHRLQAGDSSLAPANVEHSARAVRQTVVIDTFAPPREDYK